jgi:hypothetical protein
LKTETGRLLLPMLLLLLMPTLWPTFAKHQLTNTESDNSQLD